MNSSPVGVFDSGIGGLTVLKEIHRALPNEGTLYLGDTARVPYGIRSPETVTKYAFENTDFLVGRGIKLLIIACNTVSAVSLDKVAGSLSMPVIGVIEPGARAAVMATRNKRVGVIGTEATINSNAYTKAIRSFDADIEVISLPCPLFVPLVEEGFTDNDIAAMAANNYLSGMKGMGIDTLVLGCTHYPLLKNVISSVMGKDITLIDSATETVKELKRMIEETGMENSISDKIIRRFYVTDSPERFIKVGERFLGQRIEHIEKINLGGC